VTYWVGLIFLPLTVVVVVDDDVCDATEAEEANGANAEALLKRKLAATTKNFIMSDGNENK
jgi:hypothetical protein